MSVQVLDKPRREKKVRKKRSKAASLPVKGDLRKAENLMFVKKTHSDNIIENNCFDEGELDSSSVEQTEVKNKKTKVRKRGQNGEKKKIQEVALEKRSENKEKSKVLTVFFEDLIDDESIDFDTVSGLDLEGIDKGYVDDVKDLAELSIIHWLFTSEECKEYDQFSQLIADIDELSNIVGCSHVETLYLIKKYRETRDVSLVATLTKLEVSLYKVRGGRCKVVDKVHLRWKRILKHTRFVIKEHSLRKCRVLFQDIHTRKVLETERVLGNTEKNAVTKKYPKIMLFWECVKEYLEELHNDKVEAVYKRPIELVHDDIIEVLNSYDDAKEVHKKSLSDFKKLNKMERSLYKKENLIYLVCLSLSSGMTYEELFETDAYGLFSGEIVIDAYERIMQIQKHNKLRIKVFSPQECTIISQREDSGQKLSITYTSEDLYQANPNFDATNPDRIAEKLLSVATGYVGRILYPDARPGVNYIDGELQ